MIVVIPGGLLRRGIVIAVIPMFFAGIISIFKAANFPVDVSFISMFKKILVRMSLKPVVDELT